MKGFFFLDHNFFIWTPVKQPRTINYPENSTDLHIGEVNFALCGTF